MFKKNVPWEIGYYKKLFAAECEVNARLIASGEELLDINKGLLKVGKEIDVLNKELIAENKRLAVMCDARDDLNRAYEQTVKRLGDDNNFLQKQVEDLQSQLNNIITGDPNG